MKNRFLTKALVLPIMAVLLAVPSATDMVVSLALDKSDNEISYVHSSDGNYDIYYDDSFFDHNATKYSPQLATLSIFMAKYSMNEYNAPTDSEEKADEYYKNQSKRLNNFFDLIGFSNFSCNDDYKARTGFDTIGIGSASKKIGKYTVIATTVRSGGYALEWSNNVWLGDGESSDYMHEGWYNAANRVVDFIAGYITENNIQGEVKLWLSGFSRGGAVINLASAFIDKEINNKNFAVFKDARINVTKEHVYAYTFEAAQGANINSKTMPHPRSDIFNNIFNVVNPNDLVTKVGMSAWGFTRFGIDKFITTEFYDPDNFAFNREITKLIHAGHSNDNIDDGDKIQPYESNGILSTWSSVDIGYAVTEGIISIIQGATGNIPYWIQKDDEKKFNYDGNILMTIVLDKICELISSRSNYVLMYQDLARDFLLQFMSDNPSMDEYTLTKTIWHLILEIAYLLPLLNAPAIVVNLTATRSNISWYRLTPLLTLLKTAYDEIPSDLLTLAFNAGNIMVNHGTDVNVAHLCAQDELYINYFKKEKSRDDLKVVPLRDSASFKRLTFKDFNQLYLYQYTDSRNVNKKQIAQVDGCSVFAGEVKSCNKGVIIGLYSYTVSNNMEVFLPADKAYNLRTKSFSMKPVHEVYMKGTLYKTNEKEKSGDNYYKRDLQDSEQIKSSYYWFDSDYYSRDIDSIF